jgi:hypothetical protein
VGDGQIKIKTFWVFFVRLSVLCCATTHQTRFMFQFPAGRHRHRCRSVRATADATGRFVSSPWARPGRILKGIFFGTSARLAEYEELGGGGGGVGICQILHTSGLQKRTQAANVQLLNET